LEASLSKEEAVKEEMPQDGGRNESLKVFML